MVKEGRVVVIDKSVIINSVRVIEARLFNKKDGTR